MGALRPARSFSNEMSPSPGAGPPMSYPLGSNQPTFVPNVHQGLPTLIVMIVVLMIILLFCFWGAPAVRSFCKRKICCFCPMDEPNMDQGCPTTPATPTIILLPFGRMLVVDRRIFTQLQADYSGIDFMELSANLIRSRQYGMGGSSASILDSEGAYKMRSSTSLDCFPPSYEDIFGPKHCDLPPSYSQISMMAIFDNTKGNDVDKFLWNNIDNLKRSFHNFYQNVRFVRNSRTSRSLNDIDTKLTHNGRVTQRASSTAVLNSGTFDRRNKISSQSLNDTVVEIVKNEKEPQNYTTKINTQECNDSLQDCPSTSSVDPSMKGTLLKAPLNSSTSRGKRFSETPCTFEEAANEEDKKPSMKENTTNSREKLKTRGKSKPSQVVKNDFVAPSYHADEMCASNIPSGLQRNNEIIDVTQIIERETCL